MILLKILHKKPNRLEKKFKLFFKKSIIVKHFELFKQSKKQ